MDAETNRATWQQLLLHVSRVTTWQAAYAPILLRAIESGVAPYFRAGAAMDVVMFSTLDHHGIQDEPHVVLEMTDGWALKISIIKYRRKSADEVAVDKATFLAKGIGPSNLDNQFPIAEGRFTYVSEQLVLPTLLQYLRLLWEETSTEPLPAPLR